MKKAVFECLVFITHQLIKYKYTLNVSAEKKKGEKNLKSALL